MNNYLPKIAPSRIYSFFLASILLIFSSFQLFAQTVSISGRITTSRWPVDGALIRFIDEADTTLQFSAVTDASGNYQLGVPTSVQLGQFSVPKDFGLAQNYPNPFSSVTAIQYNLQRQADVQIIVFNILGREVREYSLGMQTTGSHNIVWDGRNNQGQRVADGIYLYRLQAEGITRVKKMMFSSGLAQAGDIHPANFAAPLLAKQNDPQVAGSGTYTMRIENTPATYPVVIPKQIDHLTVAKDTTISLSVDNITTARVDLDSVHQIIRGFGASNILLWRPDMTTSEVERAFGTGDGQLGFTILRIMVEADKNRWPLYITTAKKAQDLGAIVIASPWHAPSELAETVNGINRVRHDKYAEYASHLDSFNTFMANNGVTIYGLSVQNEPDITDQWTSWTTDEMFDFMKNYAHLINGTNVMAPESFQFRKVMSDPILNDSMACANTDIVCGHIYGGGLASYPLAEEKGKESWMTEYLINELSHGIGMDTSWTAAMLTGQTINDCMAANMNAYVWWYLVRYYGPMCDGKYLRKGELTKKGYVMSQYARFVRPGDVRVESTIFPPTNSIRLTAYKDNESSKTVIVALNQYTTPMEVAISVQNGEVGTLTPYTTSAAKDVSKGDDLPVTEGKIIVTLAALSVTTFVSN